MSIFLPKKSRKALEWIKKRPSGKTSTLSLPSLGRWLSLVSRGVLLFPAVQALCSPGHAPVVQVTRGWDLLLVAILCPETRIACRMKISESYLRGSQSMLMGSGESRQNENLHRMIRREEHPQSGWGRGKRGRKRLNAHLAGFDISLQVHRGTQVTIHCSA